MSVITTIPRSLYRAFLPYFAMVERVIALHRERNRMAEADRDQLGPPPCERG